MPCLLWLNQVIVGNLLVWFDVSIIILFPFHLFNLELLYLDFCLIYFSLLWGESIAFFSIEMTWWSHSLFPPLWPHNIFLISIDVFKFLHFCRSQESLSIEIEFSRCLTTAVDFMYTVANKRLRSQIWITYERFDCFLAVVTLLLSICM